MEREEYRRSSLETWSAMAPGWERWREKVEETSAPVIEWLLRELRPEPGETILELAAGPGGTGFAAAEIVGEEGRLVSTDFSPAMVDVAGRRRAELGLQNVEHRVMDAERMDLEDDSVDGVICKFGYMLMADPSAALAETRRVLRPGGRLSLAVWSAAERNQWISIMGRMLVDRGHMPRPELDAPGMFSMAREERTRALLEEAGFTVDRMEEVPVHFVYHGIDDYVDRARDTGAAFAMVYREVSEEEREAMRRELAAAFAPFASNGRYVLPGLALAAAAS